MKADESAVRTDHTRFRQIVALLTVAALAVAAIHERQEWTASLLWCGALMMVGALFGLFFAVPRFRVPPPDSELSSAAQFTSADPRAFNTNLESIADWITKILIGVALADLREMPEQLRHFTGYVESSLMKEGDEPFVTAMILYFLLGGFIVSYVESRLYFRQLASMEGTRTIGSLSKALEFALSAPVMVDYHGVICVRLLEGSDKLNAGETPIPLRPTTKSVDLEVWLQPHEPHEFGIAFARVSVTGGEKRSEAEFEIRLDSDTFQPDKVSQSLVAPTDTERENKTHMVRFHAEFNELARKRELPFGGNVDDSPPENPLWIMLFQRNRLVQTVALDFTPRY